jgi:hypothetical protein
MVSPLPAETVDEPDDDLVGKCLDCGFFSCVCFEDEWEDDDEIDDTCEHGNAWDEDCEECDFATDPMGLP